MKHIRVCIIDDDIIYRKSLGEVLLKDERIKLSGLFSSAGAFLPYLKSPFHPDVCLVDRVLPDMSGIDCIKRILKMSPHTHLILMTAYPNPESLAECKQLGVDYIEKGTLGEIIIDKIVANLDARSRELFVSIKKWVETDGSRAADLMDQLEEIQERAKTLSTAQEAALRLKQEGRSVREIAELMRIGPKTVETHLARGLKKLGLPNLLQFIDIGGEGADRSSIDEE